MGVKRLPVEGEAEKEMKVVEKMNELGGQAELCRRLENGGG
jgi:hypothetical protein